ncbi:uncharacterized protein K460DRAFT_360901 [Cucurbitaria berberidis CBS 394.84]|uniref:Uncharacterized protein n=1 Tax=Cucurbitaria berberidis CBS 394.84 TaxID=1168544 RepID=A0A9P4GQQ8_9PLEO|nr:uncharacterized protein K460DRAFT_360901 [Cucurbitaria berberidis CBS 394.84]KAF1850037.1 hypothetical protein K460DRAFT_360901 [Cucurbitaria berberidis CBS 394.84]
MGGRLSKPKGPDGMSEASKPTSANAAARLSRNRGIVNGRTIMAPLAALTMAALLFVYTRTSIRAAKLNAQKHREADGGQISWHKESMRRHGHMEKVEDDRGTLKEALMGDIRRKRPNVDESEKTPPLERSDNDQELRKMMGRKD